MGINATHGSSNSFEIAFISMKLVQYRCIEKNTIVYKILFVLPGARVSFGVCPNASMPCSTLNLRTWGHAWLTS